MIRFLKERFLAVFFLSIIFTLSSLFWTSDTVYNQEDLSSVELGWPANFISQNKAFSLTPPDSWFPHEIGFGLPQEYPVSVNLQAFAIDISFSFVVIFLLTFAILKTYPNFKILSEIIKARYIIGFTGSILILLILYMIFSSNVDQLQRGVGIPPPIIEKPMPSESGPDFKIYTDNPNIPGLFESKELGFSFKYPDKYKDVSYFISDGYRGSGSGKIFNGGIFEKICPPDCLRDGISIAGMTQDYSAPRGGSPTDNLGYIKKDGKYFIVRIGGNEVEVLDPVEEIKTPTAEGILVRGYGIPQDGPGLGWNEGTLLAVFNLKESEFKALNFFASNIDKESEEDFLQVINSVNIYGYNASILPNELSPIEELMYRFNKNGHIPPYTVLSSSNLRWNDSDGYSILIPAGKSLSIHKPEKGCLNRSFIPGIFSEELSVSKDVFEGRGFILNDDNSSADVWDNRLYDYVQAYEKDGEMCRITVNTDCMSYKGSGFNVAHGIYISCGSGLEEARAEQMPFLEALDLKDKKTVVRIRKQVGDFFEVGISPQRTGAVAVVKKESDSYRVLFVGQEAPSCEIIDTENIPGEVLSSIGNGSCFESNGEYRRVDKSL